MSMLSVVSPAFNEARNLPAVYEKIRSLTEGQDLDWEWVIVDDHSTDDTPKVIAQLAQADRIGSSACSTWRSEPAFLPHPW